MHGRLPRDVHAVARLHHVAHHDAVHMRRVEAGAAHAGRDHVRAQRSGGRALEGAAEARDGGPDGATDDDVLAHGASGGMNGRPLENERSVNER